MQGVVGGLYARAQGEPEPVWQAIYDHYKPESMEDAIPRNAGRATGLHRGQARYAARLLRRRADPHRVARSVRAAARGAGHRQDHGGGQTAAARSGSCSARSQRWRSSSSTACASTSARCAASATTKSTPCWLPAGTTWWTWKRAGRHPGGAAHGEFRAAGGQLQAHPQHSRAGAVRRRRRDRRGAARSRPGTRNCTQEFLRVREAARTREYRPALETIASIRPRVDLFFDKVLVNAPDPKSSPEPADAASHAAGGVFHHRGFF